MKILFPLALSTNRSAFVVGFAALLGSLTLTTQSASANDAESPAGDEDRWVTSLTTLGSNQQTIVMATADGLLLRESSVLTASSGSPNQTEEAFRQPVASWAVAATPDGSTVFSTDYRGNLTVYQVGDKSSKRHDEVFERWTRAIACSPDGADLLAGNEAGKLFVWNVADNKVANTAELDASSVMDIAFAPDGKSVAVADGAGHVHLLNWPKLDAIGEVAVSEEAVWSVCFDAEGKQVLAGAADNHLYRFPAKADAKAESIAKATDWVTDIARNRQGVIAAAELGGRVHLFAADGTAMGPPLDAASGVWTLCWTNSGSLMVGTRKDGVQIVEQKWGWVEAGAETAPSEEEAADDDEDE